MTGNQPTHTNREIAENLHRREGSMRSPNVTESNSASDASTDHRAVSSKTDSPVVSRPDTGHYIGHASWACRNKWPDRVRPDSRPELHLGNIDLNEWTRSDMFLGVATLILFSSFSLIGTIFALRIAPHLFSEIWLFNAVCTNVVINAALLLALIICDYTYFESKIISHALYAAIIASLILVAFFGVVIVSFDRSISVYFLSSMYEREKFFRPEDLEALLWEGYFIGQVATQRRIEEQTQIANMAMNGTGEIYITTKGQRFVEINRIIAQFYNTRQEFLWPNGGE